MHVVKIRRVGNSNVVTLPHELEEAGYTAGTSVVVEQTSTGEVFLVPEGRIRDQIEEIGRRVIADHREALDLMEAYDRGEAVAVDGEIRRTTAPPTER
jgi:antitoxin component of MazEF toxin-antitoxin module